MDARALSSQDPLLTRALLAGEQAWRHRELARARRLLRLALGRADALGDAAGALSAHQLLGHIAFDAGDLDVAQAHHRAVLEQSGQLNLALGVASALHNLGLVAAARGDEHEARQLIDDAVSCYEAIGYADGAATARANLAAFVAHWARRPAGSDER